MKVTIVGASRGIAALIAATAAHAQVIVADTVEFAKVVNYSPIPGPQVATQVCTDVTVQAPAPQASQGTNTGGAVVGGLVGALVGSRFGGGHGRDAATVAGAIGGAVVGGNMGSNSNDAPGPTVQRQCQNIYSPGPTVGYNVKIDYKGQILSVTTRNAPGEYVRVHNHVTLE